MDGTETLSKELLEIDTVIAKHRGQHGELLGILEETQLLNEQQYLSEEVLNHVAFRTGVPLSRVYNVVTFYSFFNLKPQGRHKITVCRGTACHTKGSKALLDPRLREGPGRWRNVLHNAGQSVYHIHCRVFRPVCPRTSGRHRRHHSQQCLDRHAPEAPEQDLPKEGQIMKVRDAASLEKIRQQGLAKFLPEVPKISVGAGTCGLGNGANDVYETFLHVIKAKRMTMQVNKVGCFGFCAEETLVNCYIPGQPLVILHKVTPKDVEGIVDGIARGMIPLKKALCKIEEWDFFTSRVTFGTGLGSVPAWHDIPFFKGQKKIVLREAGLIDPEAIGK